MIFDYAAQKTFIGSIAVDDPGNTALQCFTDDGMSYLVIIRTIMGKTSILTSGPVLIDCPNSLLDKFNLSYLKINFNEKQIYKTVSAYLNDVTKKISQVEEISIDVAIESITDIKEAFNNI